MAREIKVARARVACRRGRLSGPDDMADAVALLAGSGRRVNGQVLYANGRLL